MKTGFIKDSFNVNFLSK